ncbi:MAG: hypothetical protein N2484_04200 [Clostridia bacterium]|nr:hypothetical protein [Clostridia bacterium]
MDRKSVLKQEIDQLHSRINDLLFQEGVSSLEKIVKLSVELDHLMKKLVDETDE